MSETCIYHFFFGFHFNVSQLFFLKEEQQKVLFDLNSSFTNHFQVYFCCYVYVSQLVASLNYT